MTTQIEQEEIGQFAHIKSKYNKFLQLVDKLSPDFVVHEILPAFLSDEELTIFIGWMEDRIPNETNK
jgi:hypothetical protein